MTACAHSNRTSRPPSPRCPSIPERVALAACLTEHVHSFHHRLGWGWRGCFPFFFKLLILPFCLCSHPHYSRFQFCFAFFFLSALCQTHLSGPCSPASRIPSCPHLCYRPGLGSLSSACPGLGLWAVGEIPVFNRHKAPVRGEAWSRGQPASAQLLLSEAAFLAPSSGSEWPGGGQSGPLLPWG